MIELEQQVLFDYGSLDNDTRVFVQEKAQSIHARLKRTAEDVIAIGQDLIEVKARLPHGNFIPWLQSEFGMSRTTAWRFMTAAKENPNVSNCNISAFYELNSPSTPDVIVEMVQSGRLEPTLPAIREAKREIQEAKASHAQTPFIPFTEELDDKELDEEEWNEIVPTPEPEARVFPSVPVKSPTLTALQSSESNEWFTPDQYVGAARELMGGIDVDPASNDFANEIIQATTYYDINANGLDKPWHGRVWLNPPYGRDIAGSNQDVWSKRLLEQYKAGITTEAVLLVNANTEAKWFQPFYDYLICLTNHRIRFYTNDGTSSQPTQGNALIYLGTQQERFIQIFKQFGRVIKAVD